MKDLKTNGVDKFFWEISTKGNLRKAINNDILDLKIKHIISGKSKYQNIIIYCNEFDYIKMCNYIFELKSEDVKVIGIHFLKTEDILNYSKFKEFYMSFEKELIEFNKLTK